MSRYFGAARFFGVSDLSRSPFLGGEKREALLCPLSRLIGHRRAADRLIWNQTPVLISNQTRGSVGPRGPCPSPRCPRAQLVLTRRLAGVSKLVLSRSCLVTAPWRKPFVKRFWRSSRPVSNVVYTGFGIPCVSAGRRLDVALPAGMLGGARPSRSKRPRISP